MNLNDGIAARRTGWIPLLTAAVMLFSFALACATRFQRLRRLRHYISAAVTHWR
jgi:hypothetical protein